MDDGSEPLQDGVEHDHVSSRELEESPKGACEIVTRPSPDEHDDMHEVSDDSQEHHEISNDGSNTLKSPLAAET